MKRKLLIVSLIFCLIGSFLMPFSSAAAPAVTTAIVGHNLALEENVELVYYVEVSAPSKAEQGVLIWLEAQENYSYENATYIINSSFGTIVNPNTGKACLKYALTELSAEMMATDIYAKSFVKEADRITYSTLDKYSVLQYGYNKKESTTVLPGMSQTLGEVVADTLTKGAEAQIEIGYRLDRLANATFYLVSVENATLADQTTEGLFQEGDRIDLIAGNTLGDKIFTAWKNSAADTVASTASTTVFAPPQEETYVAVYAAYSLGLDYTSNGDGTCAVSGIGTCTDSYLVIPSIAPDGNSVVSIAEHAFENCETITGVRIPDSVLTIEVYAFCNCSALQTVSIPDTVLNIGDKAFSDCLNLKDVVLPETVKIGLDVFRGSIHVILIVQHNLLFVEEQAATCEVAGHIGHFVCLDCGNYYADAEGLERLYDVSIPNSHEFVGGQCIHCGAIHESVWITDIEKIPYLGKFALGTLENAIGLPEMITVYTADGNSHILPIIWDISDYDKSVVGEYWIHGHIQAAEYQFADGLSPEIEAGIEIVDFMKGTADIVFILDISGSMGDEINNVKNNIVQFAQAVEEQGVSARWSAITFSDFTCSLAPNEQTTLIQNGASDWFVSATEYKTAISSIVLASGGDAPEVDIDGLMMASTLSTRKDARTFFILLTDATYKVDNHYGVTSLNETVQILDDKGVNVSVITSTSLKSTYSPLTTQTGGIWCNINGNFSQDLLNQLVPIIFNDVVE